MRAIKWIVINGAFAAFIYAAYILNSKGAENVATLFAWICIIASPAFLTQESQNILKNNGRSVPQILSVTFEVAVTITFAWFGAWITALGYAFHTLILEAAYLKATKTNPDENG
jgi:hypothetical protein